jgi:enoyl-CoA hydratase/carnithine racemase
LIGRSRALEMLVTGCRLDAREALECGLVQKISANPVNEAIDWVRTIARAPRTLDSQINSTRE